MPDNIISEIYVAQWELNTHIFRERGLGTYVATILAEKPKWLDFFRKAYVIELEEYDAAPSDEAAKVELIDMLHFLVSLSHVVEIGRDEITALFRQHEQDMEAAPWNSELLGFVLAARLENCVKWKWWADGGVACDSIKARNVVRQMWYNWMDLAAENGMGLEEIHGIYMMKNQVNLERLRNGYNEDTKTEEDNEEIERSLKEDRAAVGRALKAINWGIRQSFDRCTRCGAAFSENSPPASLPGRAECLCRDCSGGEWGYVVLDQDGDGSLKMMGNNQNPPAHDLDIDR